MEPDFSWHLEFMQPNFRQIFAKFRQIWNNCSIDTPNSVFPYFSFSKLWHFKRIRYKMNGAGYALKTL